MFKTIIKLTVTTTNILIFLGLAFLITYFLWIYFGKSYVFGPPVGGDYFNALTYVIYYSNNWTLPPLDWLPFWHEGGPATGGYPFLSFYLIKPLTTYFDYLISMNFFSFASLCLFLIASLMLFWQVSKNWLLAFGFTLILILTKATYYQLTTGGYIAAASTQWYLPAILFFIFRFGENHKARDLTVASLLSGLSLLQQAPASLLMIFAPSILALTLQPIGNYKLISKIKAIIIFILISLSIGSMGLYTVYLQTFLGGGADQCASRQCWGDYPTHLTRWQNPLSPIMASFCAALILVTIFLKRKVNYFFLGPAVAGFAFFLTYALLAYFKMINVWANILFPTRTFWAANLYLLLIGASCFYLALKKLPRLFHIAAAPVALVIFFIFIVRPPEIHKDFTNTVPQKVEAYTIDRFQTFKRSAVVPDWVMSLNQNWRLDISNSGISQWFYLISQSPMTTGYSARPLGVHQDWQYFLQASTRNVSLEADKELARNRALFLIDAFAVGMFEMSQSNYPDVITSDKKIVPPPQEGDSFWRKISSDFSSPIVSPTNTKPILFVGSDSGYNYFIRSIAMTNLNSKIMIPVKGPTSLNNVSKNKLNNFDTLILYQTDSLDLEKLSDFTKNGGSIFIDTGSISKFPKKKLPDVFPMDSLISSQAENETNYQPTESNLLQNIDLSKFARLSFQNGPWKYSTTKTLRDWATPVLLHNGEPAVAAGSLGQGKIVWSGLNLPFHIVENDNFEEAKLFKNILISIIQPQEDKAPVFDIERPKPGEIIISGTDATGIYFKENYDSGWQANVSGRDLEVYKAGLDFMYIPLPHLSNPVNVKLNYSGNLITWGLFWLTATSITAVLLFILLPGLTGKIFSKITGISKEKLAKKLTKYLEDE